MSGRFIIPNEELKHSYVAIGMSYSFVFIIPNEELKPYRDKDGSIQAIDL